MTRSGKALLSAAAGLLLGCYTIGALAAGTPPISAAPAVQIAGFVAEGQLTQGGWLRGKAPAGAQSLKINETPVPLASDGRFFLAFDRDAAATATLSLRMADGSTLVRPLAIAPRHWDIQNINAPFRPGNLPDAEFQRIRAIELAQINAARRQVTDSAGWREAMIWPVQGRISGRFGSQRIYQGRPGSYHSGLDIAGGQGTPYVSPADGVVILAAQSPFTLEGNLLIIDHGMGLSSAFLHSSRLLVRLGDRVRQGQPIGEIGMTGRVTGPHLHWAMKWRDARLDPLLFVAPR
jgi:murein DD-endopeptidase MepM/ murein hydrolase activator NlpD